MAYTSFSQEEILKNFNTSEGFPSSNVYNGLQDRDGYLWFCTDKGVVKFDGNKCKVFTIEDGLSNNDIWDLYLDKQDRIWLYTFGDKIHYIKNDSVHISNAPEQFTKAIEINEDDENNISINVGSNIYAYKNDSILIGNVKVSDSTNLFRYCKYLDMDGGMHILSSLPYTYSERNYYLAKKESEGNFDILSPLDIKLPNSAISYENEILLLHNKILHRLEDGQLIKIPSLSNYFIKELIQYSDFNLLNTVKGPVVVDKAFLPHPEFQFIYNMNVNKIFEDKEKNIWILTQDEGVFLWKRNQFSDSYISDFGDNANLLCLNIDKEGDLWIGGRNEELFYLKKGQGIKSFKLQLNSELGKELKIIKEQNNELVIGLNVGIIKINKNEIKENQNKNTIISHQFPFKDFIIDGDQIIASSNKRLTIFDKKPAEPIRKIFDNVIYQLAKTKDQIWMGNHEGIFHLENNEFNQLDNELCQLPISSIDNKNKENGIWVSTQTGILFTIDNDKSVHKIYDFKTSINNIYTHNDEMIWVATNQGVFLISKQNDEYQIQGHLNDKNGIVSNEVNDVCSDGESLFIATNKGLSVVNISDMTKMDSILFLRPRIIEIYGENQLINPKNNHVFQHDENNIKFYFHSLSFSQYGNIQYKYRIPELNKKWTTTYENTANYTTLPPGEYTFQVKGIIPNLHESDWTSFHFQVQPHWSRTWWFLSLSLLSFLSLLYFYYRYRIQKIKAEEIEANAIANRFSELELQALQAQMNPHFIFNSLSAIQFFISMNQNEKAENYLSSFAILLRTYLEASRSKFISLEDEVNLIRYYIELEQMRVDGKFNFEINIKDNCNLSDVNIPSFLMQPFIENAIIHGLIPKKDPGMLIVDISKNELLDSYLIIIDDNGVGRSKNKHEIEFDKIPYISRGTQIVEERISVVNKIYESNISFNIIDKDKGETGTIVEIIIPNNLENE